MKRPMALLFFVMIAAAATLHAQTIWKVDKVHSNIRFAVDHLLISEVEGRFTDFDVTVTETGDDFTKAKVEATIKTASINTDNDRRDGHLKSDDFLNAEKFPDITFKSTSIEKTGENTYKVKGNLTIRDVTKPVVLETKLTGTVTDPYGNLKKAFRATTTIDRFEFGTKWNAALETGGLVVGKEIRVTLLLQLIKQAS